jgi:maltose O-acetyltransferase
MTPLAAIRVALYLLVARHLARSYVPLIGAFARACRVGLLRGVFLQCGRGVNIEAGALVNSPDELSIGDRSGIGFECILDGPITIGANVMMGPRCHLVALNHRFDDMTEPMIDQGHSAREPITIGDDVWIGASVIVLPGVTIGNGSVIGAGSVVTRDVDDFTVVAGNPARPIGVRGKAGA